MKAPVCYVKKFELMQAFKNIKQENDIIWFEDEKDHFRGTREDDQKRKD